MCVGMPMQIETIESGFAQVFGRGERRRVDLALVGPCQPGDWLLVFVDSARERIDAARAAEIASALDMLEAAFAGDDERAQAAAPFVLPSSMSAADLAAFTHGRRS